MKSNQELIGKTITGVVAVTPPGDEVKEIWRRKKVVFSPPQNGLQLALNVA
jgi:hypothetical protein